MLFMFIYIIDSTQRKKKT